MEQSVPLYAFLGTVFTGVIALLTLALTQFSEYKKASLQRTFQVADAIKKDEALDTIHELVNSRLTKALNEIASLKEIIDKIVGPKHKLFDPKGEQPGDIRTLDPETDALAETGDPKEEIDGK